MLITSGSNSRISTRAVNAYCEILYSIFGSNATITIDKINPLHIKIDIIARYVFCYRTSDNTFWWTENINVWVRAHGFKIGWFGSNAKKITAFHADNSFAKVYQYNSYEPNTVLCNISNGASSSVEFRKGVYYIRAQGGGGGGTYGDFGWGRGSGGGSSAGFEGYILVKRNIICNVSTGAAVSSGKWSVNGNSTQIENMFIFGGGEGGKTNEALAVGGELTVIANDDYEILTAKYLGNGNGTKVVDGNKRYGGDSVISNDGGGLPSANATSFGAGGGGFTGVGMVAVLENTLF